MIPENSSTNPPVTPTITPTVSPKVDSTPPKEGKAVSPAIKSVPTEKLGQNFDMADDLSIESDSSQQKTEPAVKVEQPKVEPIKPKVEAKVEATPKVEPIKPSEVNRDYTGFSAEEVKVLKNMSKQSFDYTVKLIKEKKELESAKEFQYLQNPNAYTLHPEYQKMQEDSYFATQEAQYWQQQLINIREGKKWTPITGWDAKGNPILGAEQEPTAINEEQVRSVMNAAIAAGQQITGKLGGFQQQYAQQIQESDNIIKQEQQKRFSWQIDPKILDQVINVEGLGDRSIKQIKQDFANLFPSHYKSSIITDIAGDLFVGLQIYAAENRALKSQKEIAEVKKEEVLRGEPTSQVKPVDDKGKSKYGVKEFDLEGMPSFS